MCDPVEDYGLISVIIPVYNSEKYLLQCIESVLAQTYSNYEILLIDDGSKDSSPQLCDVYAIKYKCVRVFHKQNGGASSARNTGIKEANGKYIFFLDSDDWIEPNTLETMIITAAKENADLVFCEAQAFDDEGSTEYKDNYCYKSLYPTGSAFEIMTQMMNRKEFHVAIWMLLLDRDIFTKNDLLFKEGIMYEDMIISYQFYCLAYCAAHVNRMLYNRRYHPNSVMTSAKTEKNYISAATVYREVARFRKKLSEEKQSPKHLIRCAYNVLNIYRKMTPEVQKKNKSDYNEIVKDILDNKAYGDKALELDCKSHFLWGAYKLKKKFLK